MEQTLFFDYELQELEYCGKFIETIENIYYIPIYSKLTNELVPVNTYELIYKIAKKYGWRLEPNDNMKLHQSGRSTQVPVTYTYYSSGPDEVFYYDNKEIIFKHKENVIKCKK